MRVSLQPAHSASTTVSTKERPECIPTVGRPEGLHEGQPTAGTLSKHNGQHQSRKATKKRTQRKKEQKKGAGGGGQKGAGGGQNGEVGESK